MKPLTFSLPDDVHLHFCGNCSILSKEHEESFVTDYYSTILHLVCKSYDLETIFRTLADVFCLDREEFDMLVSNLVNAGFLQEGDGKRNHTGIPGKWYPLSASIEVTARCNLCCTFCYKSADSKGRSMTYGEFRELVDKIGIGTRRIHITGGEPLVNPDIVPMLAYLSDEGYTTSLTTNGTLIDEHLIPLLRGLNSILVSLYGFDAASYLRTTKRDCFDAVIRGLKLLVNGGIEFTVSYTLTSEGEKDILRIFELLDSIGVPEVKFGLPFISGRNTSMYANHDREIELRNIICKVSERFENIKTYIWNEESMDAIVGEEFVDDDGFPLCGAFYSKICFNEERRIKPCTTVPDYCSVAYEHLDGILSGDTPKTTILKQGPHRTNCGCKLIDNLNLE